jgi:hypothetical protein
VVSWAAASTVLFFSACSDTHRPQRCIVQSPGSTLTAYYFGVVGLNLHIHIVREKLNALLLLSAFAKSHSPRAVLLQSSSGWGGLASVDGENLMRASVEG